MMAERPFTMIFREPLPLAESEYPGFNPRREKAAGILIDYDTGVAMQDGIKYSSMSFGPRKREISVLIAWGPLGNTVVANLRDDVIPA
jgi:hypothetical protein